MGLFFLSMLLVFLGGVLAPFFHRIFSLMKTVSPGMIGLGCILGLTDTVIKLFDAHTVSVSFRYLLSFSLDYKIDGLSAFFLIIIFSISLLAVIYSYNYLNKPEESLRAGVSYLFFGLLVVSMAMVVTAGNIFSFALSWEMMSLSSFFLVIYHHQSPENRKAGLLYFIFSHVGAMFIFGAFGMLFSFSGSYGFESAYVLSESIKLFVFFLSFIGFASKAGLFPLHVWLPHAHPAAPSHISAVMSGVMIKLGIYGILRIYSVLKFQTPVPGEIILILGAVSGVLGVVYALGQQDIKRLLAYSSVENIGIILIGIGTGMIGHAYGNPLMAILGFTGGLLHVLNHSLFKSLLFMGAGVVVKKTGTRSIEALGGLLKKMKLTGITFLIGSLAISGLPPFNGFVSELFIYFSGFKGIAINQTTFVFSIVAIISLAVIGGLALACFTRVVGVVFQGEPREPVSANEDGPAMLFPLLVLAVTCLLIGIFPSVAISWALKAVSALGLGQIGIPMDPFIRTAGNITFGASLFLMVFCLILIVRTLLYQGKVVHYTETWGCGFTQPTSKMQYTGSSYSASILELFRPIAPLIEEHPEIRGIFPEKTSYQSRILDIAELLLVNVVQRPVLFLFDKLRWIQHGNIQLYIGYILLAIVVLMFFI